jgi:hypothetical protein
VQFFISIYKTNFKGWYINEKTTKVIKRLSLSLALGLLLLNNLLGQNPNFPVGSRAVGMGDASITLDDVWGIFNNPAGIIGVENATIATSFENRFGLEGLNLITAAFVQPTKIGNFGLGVYRFGDELFNQTKITAGYAHQIGIVSLGGRVNLLQYFTEGFDPQNMLTFDFGGIGQITPQLFFGAYVTNINQARIARNEDERVPT